MPRNQPNANVADPAYGDPTAARRMSHLSDRGLFLKKFLDKGTTISAAVPSSRALARGVLKPIDFSRPSTIVELGAGTAGLALPCEVSFIARPRVATRRATA